VGSNPIISTRRKDRSVVRSGMFFDTTREGESEVGSSAHWRRWACPMDGDREIAGRVKWERRAR
jgi:hypothetical protein